MSLPKVTQPVYTVTVPGTKIEVKYRPFLMKEDKAILQARVVGDDNTVRDTIESVVQATVLNKNLDVSKLPSFIVDYLYIKIYTVSNSDRLPIIYTCQNHINKTKEVISINEETGEEIKTEEVIDKICNYQTKNNLNLNDVVIVYPDNHEDKKLVKVDDNITIKLDYPISEIMRNYYKINDIDENYEFIYSNEEREIANSNLIFSSIVSINVKDGDSVVERLPGANFDKEEFFNWLEELPKSVTEQITSFFQELPYVHLKSSMQCTNPDCLHKEEIEVIGAKAFLELS